eukprot:1256314-Rhodomonas_salina.3
MSGTNTGYGACYTSATGCPVHPAYHEKLALQVPPLVFTASSRHTVSTHACNTSVYSHALQMVTRFCGAAARGPDPRGGGEEPQGPGTALHCEIKDKKTQSQYNLYQECVFLCWVSGCSVWWGHVRYRDSVRGGHVRVWCVTCGAEIGHGAGEEGKAGGEEEEAPG